MNKGLSILFLRWFIPGTLAVAFLFVPDLHIEKASSPLASNWLARIFFVVYLVNPFIGIAKAIENEYVGKKEFKKYQFFSGDKETLSIMTYLAAVFTFLSTSIVFLLAMRVFFPELGLLTYVLWLLYTVSVGVIAFFGLRLSKERKLI
jgi:hypothetical protein